MEDDDKKITGNELDEDDSLDTDDEEDDQAQEVASEKVVQKSSLKKKGIYMFAAVCLFVTVTIVFTVWYAIPEEKPNSDRVIQTKKIEKYTLKLDSFLIPYSQNQSSYISLDFSLDVPEGPLKRELIKKRGLIRGVVYELLVNYIDSLQGIPAPEKIKDVITQGVNGSLSKGKISELYLTQFIVI
jgi:flagellar basal body-associated protein FliL